MTTNLQLHPYSEHQAPVREHAGLLVLRSLAAAQVAGRRVGLEDLAGELGLRRAELRSMLSALHQQGLIDVMRMRPTLAGFAMGRSMAGLEVTPLRRRKIPDAPASRAA